MINNAVCTLLRQHHRAEGLCVKGWWKPPGNCYFSFYSTALRDSDGKPLRLPDVSGTYCLTIYQGHVGIPAWAAGEQLYPEATDRDPTPEAMLAWYEERLSLRRFFEDHADAIAEWRPKYRQEDAERYILTWEIMAATGGLLHEPLLAYGGDNDGYGISEAEQYLQERLAMPRPYEQVVRAGRIGFAVDGRAFLPSGEIVDLWQRHLDGQGTETMAHELKDAAHRPIVEAVTGDPIRVSASSATDDKPLPRLTANICRIWYGRTVIGPKDTFGGVLVWAQNDDERAYAVAWLDEAPEEIRRNVAHTLDSLWVSGVTIIHEACSTLAGSGMVSVERPHRRVETDDLQAVADAELLALGPDGKGSG
jgi:hypothetical protein